MSLIYNGIIEDIRNFEESWRDVAISCIMYINELNKEVEMKMEKFGCY